MNDMTSPTERVKVWREESSLHVRVNNPAKHNALSVDMWEAVPAILARAAVDESVRVVVFSGEGEKAFVSGADISQFESERNSHEANKRYSESAAAATRALEQLSKPAIAMIRGFCMGGGMVIALSCDLRVASDDSKFGIPAARLGLGYGYEGVQRLVEVVGPTLTSEILFTARQFPASEALAMGLVNRLTSVEQLEAAVREYADMISANAPLTLRAAKLAIKQTLQDPSRRKLDEVRAAVAACFDSQDYAEGRRAFAEKRKPRFQGR